MDGGLRADHVEQDGKLITGQNPFSSARIAAYLVAALSGQLPPITLGLRDERLEAETVVVLPPRTFLENLLVKSGVVYFTSYEDGKLYRWDEKAGLQEFAKVKGNLAAVLASEDGGLLLSGSNAEKGQAIYRVNEDGVFNVMVAVKEAIFLNGMTPFYPGEYLVADAARGIIFRVDPGNGSYSAWLQHPLLARIDSDNPLPAVNGLKIFKGHVYASNTHRKIMVRIAIGEDGSALEPELYLTNVNIDDFAFDVNGNIYATTHIYNSVLRISPTREPVTVAGFEEGMTGSTAVAFHSEGDRHFLYATTNGGMFLPPPSGVANSLLVRLTVPFAGWPVGFIIRSGARTPEQ